MNAEQPDAQSSDTNPPESRQLDAGGSGAAPPDVKRHHGIVRLAHWLNAVVLLGMIASGLQIYVAFAHFGPAGRPLLSQPAATASRFPEWARLGGWLAGGLNWHFALAWPFVITGLVYLGFLAALGRVALAAVPARATSGRRCRCSSTTSGSGKDHPPQGKHNALQKGAYTFIVLLGALSALTGFAIYKPVQLAWLTSLFGGYELARYWHFWAVWLFVGFTLLHVALVFLVDPASLRAMITGWYRGRFPEP